MYEQMRCQLNLRPLLIEVPGELADGLVENGLAEKIAGRRSSTWQVLASVATGTGTMISLMQGPQTVAYLATKIKNLFDRNSASSKISEPRYLEATGPQGQVRIPVSPDTSVDEIATLLKATVFAPDEK
jgi:hypothetical protein